MKQERKKCQKQQSSSNKKWIIDAVETARWIPIFERQIETVDEDQAKMLVGLKGYREYHQHLKSRNEELDRQLEKILSVVVPMEIFFQQRATKKGWSLPHLLHQDDIPTRPDLSGWSVMGKIDIVDDFTPCEIPVIENRSETQSFADWKHSMHEAIRKRREQISRYPQKIMKRLQVLTDILSSKLQINAIFEEYRFRLDLAYQKFRTRHDELLGCEKGNTAHRGYLKDYPVELMPDGEGRKFVAQFAKKLLNDVVTKKLMPPMPTRQQR